MQNINQAMTLYQNVFKSDRVNAGSCAGQLMMALGIGDNGKRNFKANIQKVLDNEPMFQMVIDNLNSIKDGQNKLKIREYSPGMKIVPGVKYYSMSKMEGMPDDCMIVSDSASLAIMQSLAGLNEQFSDYFQK